MANIQLWFTDRYYIGYHRRVENGVCRYILKASKGRITAEAIGTAKEEIIAGVESPRIDLLVLYFKVLEILEIEEPELIEMITRIANEAFLKLGSDLITKIPEDLRPHIEKILSDRDETIEERAERIIAALSVDLHQIRRLKSV